MLIINLRKKVLCITDTVFWEAKMTQFVRETNTWIGWVKLTIVLAQQHIETVTKPVNGKISFFVTGTRSYGISSTKEEPLKALWCAPELLKWRNEHKDILCLCLFLVVVVLSYPILKNMIRKILVEHVLIAHSWSKARYYLWYVLQLLRLKNLCNKIIFEHVLIAHSWPGNGALCGEQ